MHFDPENEIVKLCAAGMDAETAHQPENAKRLFLEAWSKASDDFEKFTAAHYVARHQPTIKEKLDWDETALQFALKLGDDMRSNFPSLYLNIAKCYEDLNDFDYAQNNYEAALSYSDYLPDNGYGKMIIAGIKNGLQRMQRTV